jgi:hypothetical protein
MKQFLISCFLLSAVPAFATSVSVPAFYVAPNGKDSNTGTLAAPFLTLEKAKKAMRSSYTIKTTYLRAGTYSRTKELTLTSVDNKETWATYPGDANNSAVLMYKGAGFLLIHITPGGSNITISNLTLDGGTSGGAGVSSAAVFVEGNSKSIYVTGNKFVNNSNQGDLFVYNSDSIYFQGNTSGPNEYQPVSAHITDGTTHNGLFMTDNSIYGFSRMGFELTVDSTAGGWGGTHIDRNIIGPFGSLTTGDSPFAISFVANVAGGVNTCGTVWGNTIKGTSGNAQWGLEIGTPGPVGVSVEYNTMTNVDAPMFISLANGTEIENNLMTNFGNDPPWNNGAFNQDGGYNGTEWIGTNTINGSQITGDGGYLGHGPYGTKPPVCAPSNPF